MFKEHLQVVARWTCMLSDECSLGRHYEGYEAKCHVADWEGSSSQEEEVHGRLREHITDCQMHDDGTT